MLIPTASALASDYGTDHHWHGKVYEFQIRSSVPSSWHGSIREAADSWDSNTNMTLQENTNAWNYIMRDEIEDGVGCNSESVACTVRTPSTGDPDHIVMMDITFNENISFGTSYFLCAAYQPDV